MNYKLEGNGKTLVFIHGLSDNLFYWEVLATHLKKYYQVLRIDLRGHGESELGSDDISISTYSNDLNNLLNELNITNVNLVGFSLGGAVALDFTISNPQKVDSLVLMSSFYKSDEYVASIFNQFKSNLEIGFDEFYDFMVPLVLCPDIIDKHAKELEMFKQLASPNANTKAYLESVDACLNFNVENQLSEINVPTLILAGQYDEIFPLNIQRGLYNKINNSKLIVLDNTKHNLLVGKNNEKIINIIKKEVK